MLFEKWEAGFALKNDDTQETILKAFDHELKPYMEKNGFKTVDVLNIHAKTENLEAFHKKFIKEHIHLEEEIRFFVDGGGLFWFHFEDGVIISVLCEKGDFMGIPTGYKHWFDMRPNYFVKMIRIFTDIKGWTAYYTNSEVNAVYSP